MMSTTPRLKPLGFNGICHEHVWRDGRLRSASYNVVEFEEKPLVVDG